MSKKKSLVGWIEKGYYQQWVKGYPFKLWRKSDSKDEDIKVRITIEDLTTTKGEKGCAGQ